MRFKSIASISFTLCVLSGCEPVEPERAIDANAADKTKLEWRQLSDGSAVARSSAYEGDVQTIRRCFANEGDFACLFIDKVGKGYSASAYRASNLSDGHDIFRIVEGEGYTCDFDPSGTFAEHIANEHDYIDTNYVNLKGGPNPGQPWISQRVKRFMSEKEVRVDKPYFACADLAYEVLRTSIEVAATSKISSGIFE